MHAVSLPRPVMAVTSCWSPLISAQEIGTDVLLQALEPLQKATALRTDVVLAGGLRSRIEIPRILLAGAGNPGNG